jgi:hypothetical protein
MSELKAHIVTDIVRRRKILSEDYRLCHRNFNIRHGFTVEDLIEMLINDFSKYNYESKIIVYYGGKSLNHDYILNTCNSVTVCIFHKRKTSRRDLK